MKKTKILSVIILFIKTAFCQDTVIVSHFPIKEGKVVYEKVLQMDSLTRDQIYLKIKEVSTQIFANQKYAIQVDEKEGGIIAYQANFLTTFDWPSVLGVEAKDSRYVYSNVSFYVKDGRCKLVIDQIKANGGEAYGKYDIEIFESEFMEKKIKGFGVTKSYKKKAADKNRIWYLRVNSDFVALMKTIEDKLKTKSQMDF